MHAMFSDPGHGDSGALGAEAGADVLNYANAPSDVSDSLGRFLAAFAGFPL